MTGVPRVLVAMGTRPEIIKLAPVIGELARSRDVDLQVLHTGQHASLGGDVVTAFGLPIHDRLGLMDDRAEEETLFPRAMSAADEVIARVGPELVLVHGDTTTAAAVALAAHHRRIPVGHVEAGLRTGSVWAPWPEEANRRIIDALASLHFAPTESAARTLRREGHAAHVLVTGNTGIDTLMQACLRLGFPTGPSSRDPGQPPTLLVTLHRRETRGEGHAAVFAALRRLAADGLRIVFPLHPSPAVREPAIASLGSVEGVDLRPAADYLDFVRLLHASDVILTDSGGLQEEGPALGKPVLVARDVTERPEAVACGASVVVGTDAEEIVKRVRELCRFGDEYQAMAHAGSPYGDGRAAERIVAACLDYLTRPTADTKSDGQLPSASAASSMANRTSSHADPASPT